MRLGAEVSVALRRRGHQGCGGVGGKQDTH